MIKDSNSIRLSGITYLNPNKIGIGSAIKESSMYLHWIQCRSTTYATIRVRYCINNIINKAKVNQ